MSHLDEFMTIKGKNLYNLLNKEVGKYINHSTGELEGPNQSYSASEFIKVSPSTTYTINYLEASTASVAGLCYFTNGKTAISGVSCYNQGKTYTFTTPSNCEYVRFSYLNALGDKVQLEEGSTATEYEPYRGEFKTIGNIWERAKQTLSSKAASVGIRNSRKVANLFTNANYSEKGSNWYAWTIQCKPNTTYTIKYYGDLSLLTDNQKKFFLEVYPQSSTTAGTVIKPATLAGYQSTFTTSTNTAIAFRFSQSQTGIRNEEFDKLAKQFLMLNEGSTALPYYPHFAPTKVLPSLKAFGGTVQESGFFKDYQLLEYIESSGTQWIDTGVKPTSNIGVYMKTLSPSGGICCGFGQKSGNNAGFIYGQIGYGIGGTQYNGKYTYGQLFGLGGNTPKDKELSYNFLNDGKAKWRLLTATDMNEVDINKAPIEELSGNLYLNAINDNGTAGDIGTNKLVLAKISIGNSLVRDFVPVKRLSDNAIGMYDLIEGKFYGNSGTGVFTAGNVITPVQYIESDGQYINTHIPSNTVASYEGYKLESTLQAINVSNSRYIEGSYEGNGTYYLYRGSGGLFQVAYGSTYNNTTKNADVDKHTFVYTHLNGTTTVLCDGTEVLTKENENVGGTMLLCGTIHSNRTSSRHWGKKIWYNDNLILDLIPVKVGTEYCMYDLVEHKVYRNAGTGAFTGGAEIPWRLIFPYDLVSNKGEIRYGYDDGAVIPSEYERVEYIEGTGDQHIDTGVLPDADIGTKIKMAGTVYTSGANKPILGATISDLRSSGVFDVELWGSGIYFGFGTWNATTHKLVTTNVVNDIYNLELNYLNSGYFRKDSESKVIPSYSEEFANYSIYLFALNRSGSASSSNLPAKIYSAQFSKGTTIIRHFIPVKKVSNNEYGMYDLVTKKFYGNAGTGAFTGGSVISRKFITDGSHKVITGVVCPTTHTAIEGKYPSDTSGAWTTSGGVYSWLFDCLPNTTYNIYLTMSTFSSRCTVASYAKAQNELTVGDACTAFTKSPVLQSDGRYLLTLTTGANDKTIALWQRWASSFTVDSVEFKDANAVITDIADLLLSDTSYFDIQSGTLYKDWAIKVFDGTENWGRGPLSDKYWFTLTINDLPTTAGFPAKSNYYIHNDGTTDGSLHTQTTTKVLRIRHDSITATADYKSWLKARYDEGMPVILLYKLGSPTTEQKTASAVSLATKGNKTISAQAEIPVTVQAEYLGK